MTSNDKIVLRGDNMEEKDNDIVPIQFKMTRKQRELFHKVCKANGYNPSAWLRVQVINLVRENE